MPVKFSFIIPTLNEGDYIGDCIRSIKNQTIHNYEIIVADSYSKDRTKEIAESMGAKIVLEARRGPAVARNTGASAASGSIFVFADADVRFEKDFLEKLENQLGSAGGCIFHLNVYDADNAAEIISYRTVNYLVKFLISIGMPMTAGSCFAFREDIFKKVGGFRTEFMTNEDHDLAKRVYKIARFKILNINIYTSTRRSKRMGFLKLMKIYAKSTFTFLLNNKPIHGYWA